MTIVLAGDNWKFEQVPMMLISIVFFEKKFGGRGMYHLCSNIIFFSLDF
jgi:hypothetical protein